MKENLVRVASLTGTADSVSERPMTAFIGRQRTRLPRWLHAAALGWAMLWWAVSTPFGTAVAADEPADEQAKDDDSQQIDAASEKDEPSEKWKPLFDGKTLKGWRITDFAGHGEVKAEERQIILRYGELLTGVTWDGERFEFPKSNYEVSLIAKRVDGSDFFCGLTFPVGDEHASLIVGGWGGAIVGISSIDDLDASENLTTVFERFDNGKWYPIRVRVTDEKIQAWIDDRKLVDVERKDKAFSVRWEVEESRPLGIASYQCTAAIKDFKFRKLGKEEVKDETEERTDRAGEKE